MAGQPFDTAADCGRDRIFQNRAIHTIPRWTRRSMKFSPRHGGVYNVPTCSHEIPRTVSPRSSEARTAPTVFYHEPRTPRDSRPVHDPVSGSLLPTRRGCLRTPHSGHFPCWPAGATTDDPRTYRFLQPDHRASNRTCPRNRSDTNNTTFSMGLGLNNPDPDPDPHLTRLNNESTICSPARR